MYQLISRYLRARLACIRPCIPRSSVYTAASVTSAAARADPRIYRSSRSQSARWSKRAMKFIQRCWRLYELMCRASNGADLLILHVSSFWYS